MVRISRLGATVMIIASSVLGAELAATPASASVTAVVDGVVRAPDGVSVPSGTVIVSLTSGQGGSFNRSIYVDSATGAFSFTGVPAGSAFRMEVTYSGLESIVDRISWDGSIRRGADLTGPTFAVNSGERRSFDIRLLEGATVTGTIRGVDGSTIPTPSVEVRHVGSPYRKSGVVDPATGSYTIKGIPPGEYRVAGFTYSPVWVWAWGGETATTPLTLVGGETRVGVDVTLLRSASIGGTLLRDDGSTLTPRGGTVFAQRVGTLNTFGAPADPVTGRYDVSGLTPGDYYICSDGMWFDVGGCHGGRDHSTATLVTVDENQVIDGINVVVGAGGAVEGRVLGLLVDGGAPSPVPDARVRLYRWIEPDSEWALEQEVQVNSSTGLYSTELPVGRYVIQAVDVTGAFGSRYWPDGSYFSQSQEVQITSDTLENLSDLVLSPRSLDVFRVGGESRFDVGVNVSRELYPLGAVPADGVPVVYIANGYNFPDALTAGPAASVAGGAVLLVEPASIPMSVASELRRLRPQRIVVAGGPASVSPAVFEQLKTYVDEPAMNVVRAGGLDRYEASREVVRDAFLPLGAPMAIITTGANFPDALSAGPAAASQGGPVILVDGTASSVDPATEALLRDLGIGYVYIAGGVGSVSPGIEASLRRILGSNNVSRFAGSDRFDVAVLLNQEFFFNAEFALVSTGYKFPDALTGGPLAAALGAPLYLSPPECLPSAVAYDILDLDAQGVVLLGGPGSLSPAVENLQLCR